MEPSLLVVCPSCKHQLDVPADFSGQGSCNHCHKKIEIIDGEARIASQYRRQHRCQSCGAFFVAFDPAKLECESCTLKQKSKKLQKKVRAEWKPSRIENDYHVLAILAALWILSYPVTTFVQRLDPIRRQVATEAFRIDGDFRPGGYFEVHFTGRPFNALLGKWACRMNIRPSSAGREWDEAVYGSHGTWQELTEYTTGPYRAMSTESIFPEYTPQRRYRIPSDARDGEEVFVRIDVKVDYPAPATRGFRIQSDKYHLSEKFVLRPDQGVVVPFWERDPPLIEPRWLGDVITVGWFMGAVFAVLVLGGYFMELDKRYKKI